MDKHLRMNGSMELPSTTVVANNKKGKGETSTNITIGTNTECHVDSSENMCPICYESDATCMTACGHKYCNDCLGRLSKCALCRTPFQTDKPRKRRQRRREANEFLVEVERQRLRAVSEYLVEVERQRLREANAYFQQRHNYRNIEISNYLLNTIVYNYHSNSFN